MVSIIRKSLQDLKVNCGKVQCLVLNQKSFSSDKLVEICGTNFTQISV